MPQPLWSPGDKWSGDHVCFIEGLVGSQKHLWLFLQLCTQDAWWLTQHSLQLSRTKHGPLEEGIANPFSILALGTP